MLKHNCIYFLSFFFPTSNTSYSMDSLALPPLLALKFMASFCFTHTCTHTYNAQVYKQNLLSPFSVNFHLISHIIAYNFKAEQPVLDNQLGAHPWADQKQPALVFCLFVCRKKYHAKHLPRYISPNIWLTLSYEKKRGTTVAGGGGDTHGTHRVCSILLVLLHVHHT